MSLPKRWHPLLLSLEHLDWQLSHVEVWSTTAAWDRYYAHGEIGYTADVVRVRADWEAQLLPIGIKNGEDAVLLELKFDIECTSYELEARSSYGMAWPEYDEIQLWLEDFFASLPVVENVRPHLPSPVIDSHE